MQCKTRKKNYDNENRDDKILKKLPKKNYSTNIFSGKDTTFVITRVIIEKGTGPFGITISGGLDQPLEDGASNNMAVVHTVSTDKHSAVYNKLFPGDCILSIDGQLMNGMTHSEIVNLFSSKIGTAILEVKRRVKTNNFFEKFNMLMIDYKWNAIDGNYDDYGFKFELNSWPSYCHPDVKHVVVTSVNIHGTAYGTILTRDIIISINHQILYGYTYNEIDQMIKQCNGRMVLEIQRKSKSDTTHLLYDYITNNGGKNVNNNKSQIREVKLKKKSNETFGFGIVGGSDDCPLFVANVDAFSYAESAGIKVCSAIHRMNSKDVSFMSHNDVVKLIKNSNELNLLLEYNEKLHQDFQKFVIGTKSPATIKVRNNSTYRWSYSNEMASNSSLVNNTTNQDDTLLCSQLEPLRQFVVKALFDFDCDSDKSIPARGLSFKFGDLIKVTNGNDDEWWQGIHINFNGINLKKSKIGLIPSQNLMSYRHKHKSKKVKFTGQINKIASKNTPQSNNYSSQKTALKKFGAKNDNSNKNIFGRKLYDTSNTSSPANDNINNNFSNNLISNPYEIMYMIVEPLELKKQYKRPILIIGPHSDRIQLALEKKNPMVFQFLSINNDHKIVSTSQTIEKIIDNSEKAIHTLLVHDKISLDIILNNNLHLILVMLKPPSVEWLIKRYKHLSQEEATIEFNYLSSIHQKYRPYFTRIITSPDSYEGALLSIIEIIEENSSSKVWIPSKNNSQF